MPARVCATCACITRGGQKRALFPLKRIPLFFPFTNIYRIHYLYHVVQTIIVWCFLFYPIQKYRSLSPQLIVSSLIMGTALNVPLPVNTEFTALRQEVQKLPLSTEHMDVIWSKESSSDCYILIGHRARTHLLEG